MAQIASSESLEERDSHSLSTQSLYFFNGTQNVNASLFLKIPWTEIFRCIDILTIYGKKKTSSMTEGTIQYRGLSFSFFFFFLIY